MRLIRAFLDLFGLAFKSDIDNVMSYTLQLHDTLNRRLDELENTRINNELTQVLGELGSNLITNNNVPLSPVLYNYIMQYRSNRTSGEMARIIRDSTASYINAQNTAEIRQNMAASVIQAMMTSPILGDGAGRAFQVSVEPDNNDPNRVVVRVNGQLNYQSHVLLPKPNSRFEHLDRQLEPNL